MNEPFGDSGDRGAQAADGHIPAGNHQPRWAPGRGLAVSDRSNSPAKGSADDAEAAGAGFRRALVWPYEEDAFSTLMAWLYSKIPQQRTRSHV